MVQNISFHLFFSTSFFSTSLSLAGNSCRLNWVRHSSRKSSATHSCQCVQHFHLSKLWYGCQCLGFLTCAQMLMHAITHGGCAARTPSDSLRKKHTPSIAFRHLPPDSARFSYATEGALFISAQLSSDAVSALRKVPVLI